MEKLDIHNIIEIDRIRKLLINHPDLLSMFEILVIMANNRINQEKIVNKMELEVNIEPDLSSDSEDDILETI
tara:strand:- start:824 stop:1039 length:216 start_codon:yes stop_codon:yes gene_type:complete